MDQKESEVKIYWYEYRLRGFGPGCQPNDFKEIDSLHGKFGAVAYERQLTEKEMEDYDLKPINK